MIELTVALPSYRGKYIMWLALESLCRQKQIDFEWELVVIEEEFECFSEQKLLKYSKRLKKVGCSKISYTKLKEWIPLAQKWKLIGEKTSDTSRAFLLQAADCYSQPYRLTETFDIIINQDYDWVFSPMGPFYDIPTGELVVYDRRKKDRITSTGLNMAIKPYYIKGLPDTERRKGIDNFIVNLSMKFCKKVNNREFKIKENKSENWRYGVDTNGLNNISRNRLKNMRERPNYNRDIKMNINKILPLDVVKKLKDCRQYCREEYIPKKGIYPKKDGE